MQNTTRYIFSISIFCVPIDFFFYDVTICYLSLLQLAALCQVIYIIFSSAVFLILSGIWKYFSSMRFAWFWNKKINMVIFC